MKAIVHHRYGLPDVLRLEQVEKPIPNADEVLVRVRAASVNPADWYAMKGIIVARPGSGWLRPTDPRTGGDFAGTVERVGSDVIDFKVGDEVYGGRGGAFAEYICVSKHIAPKPRNLSYEQAAAVPTAGITALQGLREHGALTSGQRVVITGATGGVGSFAVQIAKAMGAHVTAVCRTQNTDLARSLGADEVIDYTKEDFSKSNEPYDLVIENASTHSWASYKRILNPDGRLVLVGAPGAYKALGPLTQIGRLMLAGMRSESPKMVFFIAKFNRPDFDFLTELIEAGKVTPVIERVYPMAETAEAMRHLGTGHTRGKVVVSMDGK